MTHARFSIGIDLGTTNCAMAFVALAGDAETEILPIRQWASPTVAGEAETLPSFLYCPEAALETQAGGQDFSKGQWLVGRLARSKAGETPGRVIHSAKSWLTHNASDRKAPFLPWGSEDIPRDGQISPVRASALILNYLRAVWNERFADSGTDFEFDAQLVTITVPASFDAVAQNLTLTAAQEAGFPETVRVLEEPQAAFYHWLQASVSGPDPWREVRDREGRMLHVLVVDVGGGTSDFSLFEVTLDDQSRQPKIKRQAVSEHILLGGDNMDLAIAHALETHLASEGGKLSSRQWDHLVAQCRDLKERVLSEDGAPEERFPVSIPGRGSSLLAGSVSAALSRAELNELLLEGFFPGCAADDRPRQTLGGLKEWGLPYAADSAITRHLAAFLSGRPRVDAILFNGGALYPAPIRRRLCEQIHGWQGDREPFILQNTDFDLAVAHGAARFGKILQHKSERIEAGAARAMFLEAHRQTESATGPDTPRTLVCILPRGAPVEEIFEIKDQDLAVRVNRAVSFQCYASTRQRKARPGALVNWNDVDFHRLPPLQTVAKIEDSDPTPSDGTVPVTLRTRINELGLLQVSCVSNDPAIRRTWPLEFDLRAHERVSGNAQGTLGHSPSATTEPNVTPEKLAAASERIKSYFLPASGKPQKVTAGRVMKSLEIVLELPKAAWNGALVRGLWPTLETCMPQRAMSEDHEEAWLILAGFLLRPGFGAAMDEARIDGLWKLRDAGLCFRGKRVKLQEYILWRRVSGGLSRERQTRLLGPGLIRQLRQRNTPPELILLAGSLERLSYDLKSDLIRHLTETAAHLVDGNKHCAPHLSALGLLLNRTPLYAGPEYVVSADHVERVFAAFSKWDWTRPELSELATLFLRAARVVDDRSLDVTKSVRTAIANKLEKAGVATVRTARLREYMPLERAERAGMFSETLPAGLIVSESTRTGP